MNPNLKQAIIEYLADEFHLNSDQISEDTQFAADLNLTPPQILDLLQRLQDALNFSLPEDKLTEINSVMDLFEILEPETDEVVTP
jgi:acyl carrier protein